MTTFHNVPLILEASTSERVFKPILENRNVYCNYLKERPDLTLLSNERPSSQLKNLMSALA